MSGYLLDYRVKLLVDGEKHSIVVLARSEREAQLRGVRKARRLLEASEVEVRGVARVRYKPLV